LSAKRLTLSGAKCSISWVRARERWHGRIAADEGFGVANFRKLRVWQVAQEIAIDAHRVTARMS
jgi:hypothetical protein